MLRTWLLAWTWRGVAWVKRNDEDTINIIEIKNNRIVMKKHDLNDFDNIAVEWSSYQMYCYY